MLKININVLKWEKRNTTTRLIGARNFLEGHKFVKISEISENQRKNQVCEMKRVIERRFNGRTLRVLRAETWLTVYRTIAIPNRSELASPWPREDSW